MHPVFKFCFSQGIRIQRLIPAAILKYHPWFRWGHRSGPRTGSWYVPVAGWAHPAPGWRGSQNAPPSPGQNTPQRIRCLLPVLACYITPWIPAPLLLSMWFHMLSFGFLPILLKRLWKYKDDSRRILPPSPWISAENTIYCHKLVFIYRNRIEEKEKWN